MPEIKTYMNEVIKSIEQLNHSVIENIVSELMNAYDKGRFVYTMGNGGSASTASHMMVDILKGVSYPKDKRFKILCLNDNIPTMLAYANDISYDIVFEEQLKNFLNPDDLVIGISGSGNSPNVVNALKYARSKKAKTIAFTGFQGGKLKEIADINLIVQSDNMERIEDIHLIAAHAIKLRLIDLIENKYGK